MYGCSSLAVWFLLWVRAGNFPAAIKVTAEYFPKKDRAFSTAIFNSGASVGALAAQLPFHCWLACMGWEWAFIIIGVLGYVWMGLWVWLYDKPSNSRVCKQGWAFILRRDGDLEKIEAGKRDRNRWGKHRLSEACFTTVEPWSFIVGKLMTDVFGFFSSGHQPFLWTSMVILQIQVWYRPHLHSLCYCNRGWYWWWLPPTLLCWQEGYESIYRQDAMLISLASIVGLIASLWVSTVHGGQLSSSVCFGGVIRHGQLTSILPSVICSLNQLLLQSPVLVNSWWYQFWLNQQRVPVYIHTYTEWSGLNFNFMGFDGRNQICDCILHL